jgi:hypothetical protein
MLDHDEMNQLRNWEQHWIGNQLPSEDIWNWSPLDLDEFVRMLKIAIEHAEPTGDPTTFFEAGAGIGTKLYVAQFGFDLFAHGWEINPTYIEFAQDLGVSIEQQDLASDDPDWSLWDIVYIAQPFKDDATEVTWERKVHNSMRPGAILMAAYASVKPYDWELFYRAPWRFVARKPA